MITKTGTALRLLLLVSSSLIAMSNLVFAQTPAPPTESSIQTKPAMTNDDVVTMAKLGFGNDVIVAKIEQVNAVDFKLEVNDLSKLKAAGVSQSVISAMLKRSTAQSEA